MRPSDDVTADVREVHDVDVAACRTDMRRRMADAYHSISDHSFAAMGRYAFAHSRFSSVLGLDGGVQASLLRILQRSTQRGGDHAADARATLRGGLADELDELRRQAHRQLRMGARAVAVPYGARASANALVSMTSVHSWYDPW